MGRGSRYNRTFYYPYPEKYQKKKIEQYYINSLDKLSKARFVQVSLMIDRAKRRVIIRGQKRLYNVSEIYQRTRDPFCASLEGLLVTRISPDASLSWRNPIYTIWVSFFFFRRWGNFLYDMFPIYRIEYHFLLIFSPDNLNSVKQTKNTK